MWPALILCDCAVRAAERWFRREVRPNPATRDKSTRHFPSSNLLCIPLTILAAWFPALPARPPTQPVAVAPAAAKKLRRRFAVDRSGISIRFIVCLLRWSSLASPARRRLCGSVEEIYSAADSDMDFNGASDAAVTFVSLRLR